MNKKVNSTRQPRKQRKSAYEAPMHARRPLLSVHLGRELRKSLKKRSALVRKGDRVRVLVGKFKGAGGRVTEVDYSRAKVFVEGVVAKMQSGKEKQAALQPSNLVIVERVQKKV